MLSSPEEIPANNRTRAAGESDLSSSGWQRRYQDGKTGWDRGEPNPMLVRWLDQGQIAPCKILVPGCGRGHEVVALAKAGFEVTAIDFAESAVEHLQSELQRQGQPARVVQSDLFTFAESELFEAIYEQTCLCAIAPSQWTTYQQLLSGWLRPSGKLLALFMQSGQHHAPPFSCEIPEMRKLFAQPDWEWSNEPVRSEHPTGMHELGCILHRGETQ
jgi:hypothetical protein